MFFQSESLIFIAFCFCQARMVWAVVGAAGRRLLALEATVATAEGVW